VENYSHVVLGKKNHGRKENVTWCIVHDATVNSFVAKVWCEVFAHIHNITVNVTAVCGLDHLA
jgi:hypothetical protein